MITTKKIEIFIPEKEKELKNEYYKKLYDMRYAARKSANATSSHLFALDTLMPYLSDEDKEKIVFLGAKGKPASKQNAPYTALSQEFKGKVDMGMISSVIQNVSKSYESDFMERIKGNRSLRSYRNNIPIPFKPDRFDNFRESEYLNGDGKKMEGIFFSLCKIPFQMKFGRDRSGNINVVKKVLSGEYKMSTSSICIEDNRSKVYLLLCVDIPEKKNKLIEGKKLFVTLSPYDPATVGVFDCTFENKIDKYVVFQVGSADEFLHRRRQIQESIHKLYIAAKYNEGGKGRKRKLQSLDRFKELEKKYIEGKTHVYSKEIVKLAVNNQCSEIVLMNQTEREKKAKDASILKDNECDEIKLKQKFIFRNWSWYGLIDKITYKAKMNGIKVYKEKIGAAVSP